MVTLKDLSVRNLLMEQTIINGLEIIETFKKHHHTYCRFKCVCGKTGEARQSKLISGITKSCGCRRAKIHQPKNTPLPPRDTAQNKAMWSVIYDANKRGIDFDLKKSYFIKLITSPCHYCGIKDVSSTSSKKEVFYHIGIDRVDSNKGYINGNVRSCCKYCNLAKNRMSENDFLAWLKRAYLHNYGPI